MPRLSTEQLTDRRIQRAKVQVGKDGKPRKSYLWDSLVSGFGVRVTEIGTKTFAFKFVAPTGEQAWMPLGEYFPPNPPADEQARKEYLSPLEKAREKAREYRRMLTDGKDPRVEKQKDREVKSLAKFIEAYLAKQKSNLKPSSYDTAKGLLEDLVVPVLGHLRITEIERFQVKELHEKIGSGWRPWMKTGEIPEKATPIRANRMLANLGRVFQVAIEDGLYKGANPCRIGKDNKFTESKGKTRFLTELELYWLGQTLKDAPFWPLEGRSIGPRRLTEEVIGVDPYALAAIRLLLATGARLNEILRLRWDQVDRIRGVLRIEEHKTAGTLGPKELPINNAVAGILAELEKLPGRHLKGGWVIQGHKNGAPLVNLQKPWTRIRKAVGSLSKGAVDLSTVRLHDLRHTHASWGVMGGLSLPQVGNLLGHTQPSTTQRYGHFDTDPRREASELISSKINSALGF